ncbi:MAG: hypothetical protein ABI411_00490 [Tahibacter sp.]
MTRNSPWFWLFDALGLRAAADAMRGARRGRLSRETPALAARSILVDLGSRRPAPLPVRRQIAVQSLVHTPRKPHRIVVSDSYRRLQSHF